MGKRLQTTAFSMCFCFTLLFAFGETDLASAFNRKFEIIPLFGFRAGGTFEDAETGETLNIDESLAYGPALNVDYNPQSQLQLIWSRQPTEIKTPSAAESSLDLIHGHQTLSNRALFCPA